MRTQAGRKIAALALATAVAWAAAPVTAGAAGGWKLPGSDTSISLGGYVKADFYFDSRKDLEDFFWAPSIDPDDVEVENDDDGAFGMHVRQSRFRLGSHTPTSYGPLNTVIEGDFFGDGDAFRLRHAYGELGPVLAGQAWSLLVDEDTAAATVDFGGPIGVISHRKEQFRLSVPMGEGFTGQAAVEPSYGGNELPTFLAALRYRADWGAVNLAGAVGRVDVDGQNVTARGFHFGAHVNATGATRAMVTLNMTQGLADIIFSGGIGTVVDASGDLRAQQTLGGMAGVSHSWSDTISTGLYFGWAENDNAGASDAAVAGESKSLQTVHANVFWSPVPQASIGFEVMHGWHEIYPKADPSAATRGEATRAQIGVQYSF